jgi:hypothetical protein
MQAVSDCDNTLICRNGELPDLADERGLMSRAVTKPKRIEGKTQSAP